MTLTLPILAGVVAVWLLLLIPLSGDNRVRVSVVVRFAERLAAMNSAMLRAARHMALSMEDAQRAMTKLARALW